MTNSNTDKHIHGIKCDVTNCQYNSGSEKCSANEIKVGPQYATTSSDTICATFKPESATM